MDAAPRPQAEDGEDPVESADSRVVSHLEESRGEANARSLALRNDLLDVNERLEVAQSKMARHGVWALLGLSPIALVPFLGLLAEGRLGLVVALSVLVVTRRVVAIHTVEGRCAQADEGHGSPECRDRSDFRVRSRIDVKAAILLGALVPLDSSAGIC